MGILSLFLAASLSGPWTGTYSLGGSAQVAFDISGKRAAVALGVGHAGLQSVPVSTAKGKVTFRLPGAPAPLVFSGRLTRSRIRGTVRQGTARGTFQVRRGRAPSLVAPGIYAGGGRTVAVVDDPYGPARLVDLDTGELHGLYPSGGGFVLGSGWRTRAPTKGTARFGASSAVIDGSSFARLPFRQLEVRFPSGGVTLSGTLTVPPGAGPHRRWRGCTAPDGRCGPISPTWRQSSSTTASPFSPTTSAASVSPAASYPGESPNPLTIETLARDAEAAVRFLRTRPEIDHDRIGLAGHSQAGWIIPLAATREPAIRFAVIFSGPAVTADENDHYQTLTGEGETLSTLSEQEIDARVLADGPGGVDPIPWIAAMHIPVLWAYGGLDQHVPPRLSVRRLAPLVAEPGRDFTIETFPAREPRSRRDPDRPDLGDAPLGHLCPRTVRERRRLDRSYDPGTLARTLRVPVALTGLALAGWLVTAQLMDGMEMMDGAWPLASFLWLWLAMSAAMMLPTVVPATYLAAALGRSATLFVVGYAAVWAATGLLAFGAARALDGAARWLAIAAVLLAAVYQLTPLKDACLRRCRSPMGTLMRRRSLRRPRARRALPRLLLGADAGPHRARHRQHALDGGPGGRRSRRRDPAGRHGGEHVLESAWVRKPTTSVDVREAEIEFGARDIRVGREIHVRATAPYRTDATVSCIVPGHDEYGTELVNEEVVVDDGRFSFELRGKCGFSSGTSTTRELARPPRRRSPTFRRSPRR